MVYYDDELDVFDVYHVTGPKVVRAIEHSSSSPSRNQVGHFLDHDRHGLDLRRDPHNHHNSHRHHHDPRHRGENAIPAAALAFSGALGSSIANLAVFPLEVIVKRMQTQRQIHYAQGGRSRRSRSSRKERTRRSSSTSSSSNSQRHRSQSRRRVRSRDGSPSRSGVDDRRGRGERSESYTHKEETYTSPYVEHGEGSGKVVWEHRYESTSSEEYYDGFFETIEKIYAREGISGFYTGAVEETAGIIGSTFMHIMIHHYLRNKRMHSQHTHKLPIVEEILIGIAASSAAKFISAPFSTVVTRKQTHALMYPQAKPPTITDIFHDVMREKGITGFWSGYSAGFLLTLNPTITYLLYEGLKKVAGGKHKRLKGGETFLLAAVSKAIATGITYPLAVARSRTQMQGEEEDFDMSGLGKAVRKSLRRKANKANNIVHVLVDIFKREGLAALYEGVMVEIMRGFVSNGISILIKESVHRTILSLYYFVMRAYNRTDDHSFRSTTRIIARDAYENAGPKRKKLMEKTIGSVEAAEHAVGSGRSKVSGAVEEGREKIGHIKDKVVEHTPFVRKNNHHKSSERGHRVSGKVKLGAAALAAGAAAAHLKGRHDRQERRDQREAHSAHGGEVVVHTKRERVAEWRDGVNESMSDAAINNRVSGHQSQAIGANGTIPGTAFHNQSARASGHQGQSFNFAGSRNRFEDDTLEAQVSDHRRTVVENVDVRELGDDRIHTGEMTVIEDRRHGHGHGGLVDSRAHIENTTIHGGHEHGHSHHGLARLGKSHRAGHDHLTGSHIHTGETTFSEEHGHSHSGIGDAHIRGGRSSHREGLDDLVDTRIVTEKTTVREGHQHGTGHGHSHGGMSNVRIRGGRSHREGPDDLIDTRIVTEKTAVREGHERGAGRGHSHSGISNAHIRGGRSSHREGLDDLVDTRIVTEKTTVREGHEHGTGHGHSHGGMSDVRIRGGRSSHREGLDDLVDTRIVTENTVREGHERGAGHGHGHGHNALVRVGKSSHHAGRNDFLDSRTHLGKTKIHEGHSFDDLADSRIHGRKSSHRTGHTGAVSSRVHTESDAFREGQGIDGLTDSRFLASKNSHHEGRNGLVDTRIIEKTTVHEGHADSHDSHRFGEPHHGRHSLHMSHSDSDLRGRPGRVLDVVNNAVAVGTAIGTTVGSAVKHAVTGHGSHHGHKRQRSHSHGRERGRHGTDGEVIHRQKTIEWRDESLGDSDLDAYSRNHHHAKRSSGHNSHRAGVSSNSRANFEVEAARHGHKSSGGHHGDHTEERIVKETHVTKFADHLRPDQALQNPGFIRPSPTPFSETREEVFRDTRGRTSAAANGPLGAHGERMVRNEESTWVDKISSAANGGAAKVTQNEETWDINDDNHTEVYNFMEEKRKAVPVSGSKVVTEQKWWDASSGKGYK